MNINKILKNIVNGKQDNKEQFTTAIVSSLNPFQVKFFSTDTAINAVPTSGLFGVKVGSNVLLANVNNTYIAMSVIGNNALAQCIVRNYDTQSIPTATQTDVEFTIDYYYYDPLGMFDEDTDNTKIIIPSDGNYLVVAGCSFDTASSSGTRIQYINVNGTRQSARACDIDTTNRHRGSLSQAIIANAGDYIKLQVYQDSGGNLSIGGSEFLNSYIMVTKI